MTSVFTDGVAGTTGLRIRQRLEGRRDIRLITLPEELRKDEKARREAANSADIVFLCLPDAAAKEAAAFIENDHTAVIDTSTAHRVDEGWVYGFAEIGGQKEKIRVSKRIANPGCHASGFIALVAPLVQLGLISLGEVLTCFSLTGYSGGGKKMIEEYEGKDRSPLLNAPRMYGLSQSHKHLPEMAKVCGLQNEPVFCPVVADYYAGMEVTVMLDARQLRGSTDDIRQVYAEVYRSGLVRYIASPDENGFLSAAAMEGRDDMEVTVCGNGKRILLVSRFDNLGKGASGAAIQNMNLLIGAEEALGLNIKTES